jgi:hypothetical protein
VEIEARTYIERRKMQMVLAHMRDISKTQIILRALFEQFTAEKSLKTK